MKAIRGEERGRIDREIAKREGWSRQQRQKHARLSLLALGEISKDIAQQNSQVITDCSHCGIKNVSFY